MPMKPPQRPARPTMFGMSLFELVLALAISALLLCLAWPSWRQWQLASRRSDARSALWSLQAQEIEHRMRHARYGELAAIGMPPISPQGHYELMAKPIGGGESVSLEAMALGHQWADQPCRHLRILIRGLDTIMESGPQAHTRNPPELNRHCWGRP